MQRLLMAALVTTLFVAGCGLKVPMDASSGIVDGEFVSDGSGVEGTDGADVAAAAGGRGADGATSVAGGGASRAGGQGAAAAKAAAEAAAGGKALFPNDIEGVTDDTIKLCVHVPITGAAPTDRNPDRFGKFYFDYVNAELGGIHGRKVEYKAYDDQYNPPYAVAAAKRCKSEGAFVISGAAGTDQLVAVAKWAAEQKVPYLMGPASVKDVSSYVPYAKMVGPDYEHQHKLLADFLVKRFGTDVNYGMIRVNSPFFDAAHDTYVAALKKHGITLKVDEVVQKDENTFTRILEKLRSEDVQVINNFTTPTIWIKMLQQQNDPTYQPTWTAVSPAAGYNLIADALAGKGNAVVFHHFNPAYPATGSDNNQSTIDRYPYAAEIRKFQQIFNTYTSSSTQTPRDDIDWSAYLAAKGLHRILEKAGRDLTRSKLWALLETYKESSEQAAPGCPADFTRVPHQGAFHVNVFTLGTRQWENETLCVDRP